MLLSSKRPLKVRVRVLICSSVSMLFVFSVAWKARSALCFIRASPALTPLAYPPGGRIFVLKFPSAMLFVYFARVLLVSMKVGKIL